MHQRGKPFAVMAALAALIFLAILVSMNTGTIRLSPVDVIKTLLGMGTQKTELVLFTFRLPRIVLALLVGMGLAVSGAIMQGISRNGLADPGILGINAGAGLTVVLLIVLVYDAPNRVDPVLMPFAALAGATLAAALVYILAWKRGITAQRLVLVGIAVGAGISSAMTLVMYRMRFYTQMLASIYLAGSIWGANWTWVMALLPWILILVPFAIYKGRILNVLGLGDTVATGVGASVERERLYLLATAVGLAGSCVALAGGVGFLGLAGPHLARKLVGPNHKVLVPTSALIGGLLLIMADVVGRNLLAPREIPVGIVVSAIGAPYFLYLMTRSKV